MRFSISFEGRVVRVTLMIERPSVKAIRASLGEIRKRLPRGARVLLDMADVGHLNAAEMGAILEWISDARRTTEDLALYTRNRSFLALLELVCAHQLVEIFDDSAQAVGFLERHDQEFPMTGKVATASYVRSA